MAWRKWDSDNVGESAGHHAINMHRQLDNLLDLSQKRTRAYTLWFHDPLEVGSVGKPRGYYFRAPAVPESGQAKLQVTYEVFDAAVNTGFRLAELQTSDISTSLGVTNGRTVKEFLVDVRPAQRRGWDPQGIPIVMDVQSDKAGVATETYTLYRAESTDMTLVVTPDPNLVVANPLAVWAVSGLFNTAKTVGQAPAASPTRQIIETVALSGLTTLGATVQAGGAGYSVNDILYTTVGSAIPKPAFKVATVGGGGNVLTVTQDTPGRFSSSRPTNPVATAVPPSGGSGCTLNVFYNDGGLRVWPPMADERDWVLDDGAIATQIEADLYGRIRVYSIHVEEVEQSGEYVTSGSTELFPIRDTYEVKKTLQSGYALRQMPHRWPYVAQENLFANRTAVHSAGPGPHGGSPSDSNYGSLLSIFPTQVWNSGTFGPKALFGAFFTDGDHFFNAAVDLERASATIYADVLFFAEEEGEFTASFFAEMYSAPSTLLGGSPTQEIDVNPVPVASDEYTHNILNYFRNISQTVGSRNNLQGLFEANPYRVDNWGGLVRLQIEMKIPDVTVAMQDYIEVICNIDEADLRGDIKAVVLSWSVAETTGMALDVLGRP